MSGHRLAGHSAARITRALNDAGVPCRSAADPGRNPHRAGSGRTLRTVAAILANPRYTGRQVQNRQPSQAVLVDPANTGLGRRQVQRRNLPGDGSSQSIPRTRRWSAKRTSSRPRTPQRRAVRPARRRDGTCRPGLSRAGGADQGSNRAGPATGPRTGAATATPAPPSPIPPGRRTPMSARTRSCRTWPPSPSCWPARREARPREPRPGAADQARRFRQSSMPGGGTLVEHGSVRHGLPSGLSEARTWPGHCSASN
jgi:hypothetical protein